MKKRLASLRNSAKNMDRRKLVALIISTLVFISTMVSITLYTIGKNDNQEALENANFTIDSFDIIDASENSVSIEFRLNVSNFDSGGDHIFIQGEYVKILLINNSLTIAELEVPLDSGRFEKSNWIRTEIPIDPNSKSLFVKGLINNVLSGNNFYLDFKGEIHYSVVKIVPDSFTFKNKLLFVVNNSALSLQINDIGLTDLNTQVAELNLQIVNPFTTDFSVEGTIDTSIDQFSLGQILVDNELVIRSGAHNYTVDWNLATTPKQVLTEILKRYNSSIKLSTELSLKINGLLIKASPDLQLSFGESLIDFNILEVTNFNTNTADGSFDVELTLELISNIPIQLNVTSILMNFTTISDSKIGVLNWVNNEPIPVPPFSSVLINNVSINFSNISASIIFEILINQAVKVPNVVLRLNFFDDEIEIIFNLDRIDL